MGQSGYMKHIFLFRPKIRSQAQVPLLTVRGHKDPVLNAQCPVSMLKCPGWCQGPQGLSAQFPLAQTPCSIPFGRYKGTQVLSAQSIASPDISLGHWTWSLGFEHWLLASPDTSMGGGMAAWQGTPGLSAQCPWLYEYQTLIGIFITNCIHLQQIWKHELHL